MTNTEKIALYIENALSEADKRSFEEELAQNADLAAFYQQELTLHATLSQIGKEAGYQADAAEWRKRQAQPSLSVQWGRVAAIAAMLVLVMGLGSRYLLRETQLTVSPEQAFAYFEAYHPDKLMGAEKLGNTFENGAKLYEKGEFTKAIDSLKMLQEAHNPKYIEAQLLMGNAYFQLKNYPQAIEYLSLIPDSSLYRDKANYDIGLAYLAQNEKDKAKIYFAKVKNQGKRGENAKRILGGL